MSNEYVADQLILTRIVDQIALDLKGFIRRAETGFMFNSSAEFREADMQIMRTEFMQRPGYKIWDIVATLRFVDVRTSDRPPSMKELRAFIDTNPELHEIKLVLPPSPHHGPMPSVAHAPNTIILGQVEHYGDPEVLYAPKLGTAFNSFMFKVKRREM